MCLIHTIAPEVILQFPLWFISQQCMDFLKKNKKTNKRIAKQTPNGLQTLH